MFQEKAALVVWVHWKALRGDCGGCELESISVQSLSLNHGRGTLVDYELNLKRQFLARVVVFQLDGELV